MKPIVITPNLLGQIQAARGLMASTSRLAYRRQATGLERSMTIYPCSPFGGSSFGFPTNSHAWDQGWGIREGRTMA
jgi:hypothetical protein